MIIYAVNNIVVWDSYNEKCYLEDNILSMIHMNLIQN